MNRKTQLSIIIAISALLGVLVFIALHISSDLSDNQSTSKFPVQIQEYMSSNTLYPDENGVCTDWVELYNSSDADINISGFKLTDESRKSRYTVPAGTVISAHGYHVIYCQKSAGNAYADFGISRNGGEELILLNRKNVLIDSVRTISLPENASAERNEKGEFIVSQSPSPGGALIFSEEEIQNNSENIFVTTYGKVRFSEVIPGNTLYSDGHGVIADLIELVNVSETDADISGYILQDGIDGNRFVFPEGTILKPGEYYVVYCSRAQREGTYADFALSRNGGETLLLYTKEEQLTDYFTTVFCGKNEAVIRVNDTICVVPYTTPGFPNTEEAYRTCLMTHSASDGIIISEIMSSNQSYVFQNGTVPDWIELTNMSSENVDLSGYGLSDRASSVRYLFPEGTILEPGRCLVIACDGNAGTMEASAHFGLSYTGGETVFLTKPDGTISFAAETVRTETDTSMIYDRTILPSISKQPTPGFPNNEAGLKAYRETIAAPERGLIISEFMPKNTCTYASEDGRFSDWIELYNSSDSVIDLSLFCLSDREDDLTRYTLPQGYINPGEYIVILCDKEKTGSAQQLTLPFGLSTKGGKLFLSSIAGEIYDQADYKACDDDRSFICGEEAAFIETDCPTPGFSNTTEGYQNCLCSWLPEGLYISEVMPSNRSVARNNGDYFDWVELCNGSSESVQLEKYYLTDDFEEYDKYQLPDVTLKSGDRIIVYCSGKPDLTGKDSYHCPFKLNGGEDRLYLYSDSGKLLDFMHIYKVPAQGSIGRQSRDSGIYYYEKPTPQKNNTGGTKAKLISAMPTADRTSGVFENAGGFFVTLSAPGKIYYTTDGSRPTENSTPYTGPLEVTRTGVIRAAALEEDKRMSEVLTLAYTMNEGHQFPILNLVIAPEDFSGAKRGIYSNPLENWQRDACIVYTDANGTVTHDCGVRISGQTSRGRAQKSFKLVFSDQYGGRLYYDIFGETCEQKSFPELLLRSGLDSKYGLYREPLMQHLALPYRDTTFVQDSVPIIVYINGEYYGIYQFMEAYSEETLADRMGVSPESITLYKGMLYPEHKHFEIYRLMEYVKTHDMRNSKDYEYIKAHLAFEDLIDWTIFQAFSGNTDISANVRYFTSSETDGRWHFALYDLECGLRSDTSFDIVFKRGQTADLIKPLLRNSEFRDMFLKRLAFLCENAFQKEDVLALFYQFDRMMRPEVERHFTRWGLKPITYIYNYNQMEQLLKADRAKQLKQSARARLHMSQEEYKSYFGE